MDWPYLLACLLLPLLASLGLTFLLLVVLRGIGLYDRPNERSLHDTPTPRGGGLAPAAVLVAGIATVAGPEGLPPVAWLPPLGGALLLAATGWRDDRAGLSPLAKLLPQLVAVGLGMVALSSGGLTFQGWLPDVLDRPVAALLWLWFVNLYNFMDGSDGLAGTMTVAGFSAYAIAAWIGGSGGASIFLALVAATLPFLWYNKPPARIFLGDVGAVPLGFLAAVFGMEGWQAGAWAAWFPLLVFLPFIADATATLGRRLWSGARVWEAHREHHYQRLVQLGFGHRGTLALYACLMVTASLSAVAMLAWKPTAGVLLLAGWVAAFALLFVGIGYHWRRRKLGFNESKN